MKRLIKILEQGFRHVVVYPLLRFVFRNSTNDAHVDITTIKKMLILRADGIGDMIVSTPMFHILKKAHPQLHLAVFASSKNEEIIRYNPNIDEVFVLGKKWPQLFRDVIKARREHYDVVFNFVFNRTTLEGVLANIIAPKGLKVGQGQERYRFYFNRMLSVDHTRPHMIEILAEMLTQVFGIEIHESDLRYEIVVDESSSRKVDSFLNEHSLCRRDIKGDVCKYMVINFAAVDLVRRMSIHQTIEIIRIIRSFRGETPVLISPPHETNLLRRIVEGSKESRPLVYPKSGVASLLEITHLIGGATYVITPDTSIIHFASAMKTPLFALYTPTAARNHQWMPWGVYYETVRAAEGESVSSLEPRAIEAKLKEFLENVDREPALKSIVHSL